MQSCLSKDVYSFPTHWGVKEQLFGWTPRRQIKGKSPLTSSPKCGFYSTCYSALYSDHYFHIEGHSEERNRQETAAVGPGKKT